MATPLYSKLLIANKDFTGEAAFEVPPNLTVVVRDIDAVLKGPAAGGTVWAYDTAGVQFYAQEFPVFTAELYWVSWRGRQVVPGPGFVYLSTDAEMDIRMSGYLLAGVAP
jgi:hypothetical protein